MKKTLIVLMMVLLASLFFVSCDSNPNAENSGSGDGDSGYADINISDLLVGTWQYGNSTDYIKLKFNDASDLMTGTALYKAELTEAKDGDTGTQSDITVSVSGHVITFTFSGLEYKYKAKLENNNQKLTLTQDGEKSFLRFHNDTKFTLTRNM